MSLNTILSISAPAVGFLGSVWRTLAADSDAREEILSAGQPVPRLFPFRGDFRNVQGGAIERAQNTAIGWSLVLISALLAFVLALNSSHHRGIDYGITLFTLFMALLIFKKFHGRR